MWLAGLACRLAIVSASIALVAVVGLLVLHQSPIYWWMSSVQGTSMEFASSYTPVGLVQPFLGRAQNVTPLKAPSAGACNVLLSQHSHTRDSDGSMTARQVLDWHKAHGYTAVAITDHNTLAGGLAGVKLAKGKDDPVVLAGMEWSHCRGHYNFLLPSTAAESLKWDHASSSWRAPAPAPPATAAGLLAVRARGLRTPMAEGLQLSAEDLVIPLRKYPSDGEIRQAFDTVHALGGIVVANHLPWSAWNFERDQLPSRDQLVRWHADYVELAHEAILDAQSLPYVESGRLGPIAGVDLHFPEQHAYGWTCLNASDPSDEASILAALRRPRAADVLFDAEGTPELRSEQALGDEATSLPAAGRFFAPLRWAGGFFQSFLGTSDGAAYSFVDGYCGKPRSHWLRWGCIIAAIFWLLVLFCGHHLLLLLWAHCRGKSMESVL